MKKTVASATALLLLAGTGSSWAANRAETFSLTPFVGGYTFDGKQHLETMPVVGLRAGYNFTDHVGAEAAFDYLRTEGTRNGIDTDVLSYNLDLLYHFFPQSSLVPFLMAGYGGITLDPKGGTDSTKGAFNYGAGLKYALTECLELRGEVRHLLFKTTETLSNVEYGIGLGFLFGGAKPAPALIAAPAPPPPPAPKPAPEPAPVVVVPPPAKPLCNLTVAPEMITQGESATLNWACQNATTAEIQPGIGGVGPQGSKVVTPDTTTIYNIQGTGAGGTGTNSARLIVNPPPAPGGALTISPDTLTKGDSATLQWSCLNASTADIQPGIGPVALQGTRAITPEANTDYTLTCKGAGGSVTNRAKATVFTLEKLNMALEVEFDTGKADIKAKYHDEIGRVAEFLKQYPTVNGTIEGHTDNVGDADMNLKLSQRRADSVRQYLIDKYGIDGTRLAAKGYGKTKPIADNKNAAGRQKNRRIQAQFETVIKK